MGTRKGRSGIAHGIDKRIYKNLIIIGVDIETRNEKISTERVKL